MSALLTHTRLWAWGAGSESGVMKSRRLVFGGQGPWDQPPPQPFLAYFRVTLPRRAFTSVPATVCTEFLGGKEKDPTLGDCSQSRQAGVTWRLPEQVASVPFTPKGGHSHVFVAPTSSGILLLWI